MASEVLVCGNDADLLRTRAYVLTSAGFGVRCVTGLQELEHLSGMCPALVIFCHSLSVEEQTRAAEYAGVVWPDCEVLSLTTRSSTGPDHLTYFNTFEGPARLIEIARSLTGAKSRLGC